MDVFPLQASREGSSGRLIISSAVSVEGFSSNFSTRVSDGLALDLHRLFPPDEC